MKDTAFHPAISVIIPAKNEQEFLPTFLKSIQKQTYDNLEVVVVDDGSTDDTPRILSQAKKESRHRFKVVTHSKSRGLTISRNDGVRASKGEFITMFDADNDINDVFFKVSIPSLKKEDVIGVEPEFDFSKDTWVEKSLVSILGKRELDGSRMPFIWRKKHILEIGLWDESLAFGGDKDIQRRAAEYMEQKGLRVAKVRQAVVKVHMPHTVSELFHQQQYYGRGTFLFIKGQNLTSANILPLAKMAYPLVFIGPLSLLLLPGIGFFIFLVSIPYLLFEIKRTLRGLGRGEKYALATILLDGVKSAGLVKGVFDYLLSGERYRR